MSSILASCCRDTNRTSKAASVDVIIPVYGNRALTLRTFDSLLKADTTVHHELVVVDDASPDPVLRQENSNSLAGKGLITLLTNARNIGFVSSVNRGMALHSDRDIVLLNSDTRVFGDWLGRLLGALRNAPRTGTATPLSNAATILSYPITLRDNHLSAENDPAVLDTLCARLGFSPVEVPTAHGFCMAISRKCLNEVGPFDAVNFGRGYGEENDFCLRASASGWRHVAATNVFVWHRGGASFGHERETRVAAAQVTLERLHPGYRLKVQRFINRDPLKAVRAALDTVHLATTGRVTLRLVAEIGPFAGQYRFVTCNFPAAPNLPRLAPDLGAETLAEIMRNLAISRLRLSPMDHLALPFRERVVTAACNRGDSGNGRLIHRGDLAMKISKFAIQGPLLLTVPLKFTDDRGFVSETYSARWLEAHIGFCHSLRPGRPHIDGGRGHDRGDSTFKFPRRRRASSCGSCVVAGV